MAGAVMDDAAAAGRKPEETADEAADGWELGSSLITNNASKGDTNPLLLTSNRNNGSRGAESGSKSPFSGSLTVAKPTSLMIKRASKGVVPSAIPGEVPLSGACGGIQLPGLEDR